MHEDAKKNFESCDPAPCGFGGKSLTMGSIPEYETN
jgi:hypothetical protein